MNKLFMIYIIAMGLLLACSNGGNDDNDTSETTDNDSETDTQETNWVIQKVEDENVGIQTHLAIAPDNSLALAYFAGDPFSDGICDEIETNPPIKMRQELRFATRSGGVQGGSWTTSTIDQPVISLFPSGVKLAFDNLGTPTVAYTGGEPEGQFCGPHDAIFGSLNGGQWSFQAASTESGDSATGSSASDSGFVVGRWAALAYDQNNQPAILHKDSHFGALQGDDLYRADAEFAWRQGGGWSHEAVDFGEGAGDFGDLLFDEQNRPVAFYYIPVESQPDSRHGVWAARRTVEGEWEKVKLHSGPIHMEISAGINPNTGEMAVAFYSTLNSAVRIRTLPVDGEFTDPSAWATELVGKPQYDEGRHVSLAFSPSGQMALSYHRCKLITATDSGCTANDEALVFALKQDTHWQIETIREADSNGGSCGDYTALEFDTVGNAHIAFRCQEEKDHAFVFRLFVASKKIGVTYQ